MKMAIQRATRYSVRFVLFAFALLVLSLGAAAAVQNPMPRSTPEPPPSPTNAPSDKDERPLTSFEEEIKAKRAIDHESEKKIERLEKLTRKIRNEAGGEDEEVEIVNRPSDIGGAVKQIADSAESLSKTVQKTPRQVVSAAVIGNANVLLQLVKLLRAFTRP